MQIYEAFIVAGQVDIDRSPQVPCAVPSRMGLGPPRRGLDQRSWPSLQGRCYRAENHGGNQGGRELKIMKKSSKLNGDFHRQKNPAKKLLKKSSFRRNRHSVEEIPHLLAWLQT